MVSIVPLVPEDAPRLAILHRRVFGDHAWTEAMLTDGLVAAAGWGLKLCVDELWLGFALCQQLGEECEILTFGIVPDYQGRGFGRTLLQAVYDAAKVRRSRAIFLEVAADNPVAQRLYHNFGFICTGQRSGYYPRPTGAVAALLLQFDLPTLPV